MDTNAFNTLAEVANREYFAWLFGTPLNRSSSGIDLIDNERKIAVELKSAVAKDGLNRHNFSFKIGPRQIYEYPKQMPGYQLFWAFMPFELKKQIAEISPKQISESIVNREIWLFPWNYIHTFTAFDEEIYNEFGSGDYEAAFRIICAKNPRQTRQGRREVAAYQTLFAELERPEQKKYLMVARSDLHIRPDRKSQIIRSDTAIYFDIEHCRPLFDSAVRGPYQRKESRQIGLEFA